MIENQILLDYVGKTKTKNLIDEIQSAYFEIKKKSFPESVNPVSENTLISAINDGEIKSLGMSCLNDLLLDNFCNFWAGAFMRSTNKFMTSVNDVQRDMRFRGTAPFSAVYNHNQNVSIGSTFQVGQGLTPAARDDFGIETAFPAAPESNRKNTGIGVYTESLARVNVAGTITPTTNPGVISEFVMYAVWQYFPNQAATDSFALSRDNISPGVAFSALDTINIDYAIQM